MDTITINLSPDEAEYIMDHLEVSIAMMEAQLATHGADRIGLNVARVRARLATARALWERLKNLLDQEEE